jgi:hypothetical protein
VPIDEEAEDEYCSPLKRKVSPLKKQDSARSHENISPTKGQLEIEKHSMNESADDQQLVLKTMKIETAPELDNSSNDLDN